MIAFLSRIQLWIGTYLHCLESWVLVWGSGNEAVEKEETRFTLSDPCEEKLD